MDIPEKLPNGTYQARIVSYEDGRLCWEITEGAHKGKRIFGIIPAIQKLFDEPQEIVVRTAKA